MFDGGDSYAERGSDRFTLSIPKGLVKGGLHTGMAKKRIPKKKQKKIVRYRRPLNINIGMIIFTLIFLYMAFSVTTYLQKDKVQFYEVVEGSLVDDEEFTGIILREESIKTADRSGNINYYVREGKRASVGTRIYSLDETGSMASFLADNPDYDVTLNSENLSDLKKQLSAFSAAYTDENFSAVYNAKYALDAAVLEYVNFNALDNLDNMMQQTGVSFQQVRADQAGIVSYAIDSFKTSAATDSNASYPTGMQDISQISEGMFDRNNYVRKIIKSGDLVEAGTPVYKIITSDLWSVVFPLTQEEAAKYSDKEKLTVSFKNHDITTDGAFSMLTGSDGKTYGKLNFEKYMVQFASERYLDFEIISEKIEGLKIPVSAVTEKNFYLIPIDYITQGGNSTDTGFLKEVYSEAGTSASFVPATIYYSTDEYYYIDMGEESQLKAGDYVVKPNSTDRYQIGASASLQGVYNINKGYAVFKQIKVLSSSNEYYTIEKNMDYGLSVYDHIVLDADTVQEGQLIYQ